VYYLDDDACRAAASGFPGWRTAERDWKASSRELGFKRFVSERYGLVLDRIAVHALAVSTREREQVPPELEQVLRQIVRRAAGPPD